MDNLYKVHYEIDTGFEFRRDTAIVKAVDKKMAVEKLESFIGSIAMEYMVTEVFFVEEFVDEIFSNQFKPKRPINDFMR